MITLFSDLGLDNASVAVVKNVLHTHLPHMAVADISHEAEPFLVQQAAYTFSCAWHHYPPGTIHLLLFHLYSNASAPLVLSQHKGHYFLSPVSNLLPSALHQLPEQSWLAAAGPHTTLNEWVASAADVIAKISAGAFPFSTLPPFQLPLQETTATTIPLTAQILYIDNYGNAVTDLHRSMLSAGQHISLILPGGEELNMISTNISDAGDGYSLCRFNSSGFLEVCISHGNAAQLLGLCTSHRAPAGEPNCTIAVTTE